MGLHRIMRLRRGGAVDGRDFAPVRIEAGGNFVNTSEILKTGMFLREGGGLAGFGGCGGGDFGGFGGLAVCLIFCLCVVNACWCLQSLE